MAAPMRVLLTWIRRSGSTRARTAPKSLLALAHQPLEAVGVVALAFRGRDARFGGARGHPRVPAEDMHDRLIHAKHVVAAGTPWWLVDAPLSLAISHCPRRSIGHLHAWLIRTRPQGVVNNYQD